MPKTSSFYEDRYNLGMGMRFSFPNIEVKVNSDGSSHKFFCIQTAGMYTVSSLRIWTEPMYFYRRARL
ncbi:hypothetical protein ACFSQ7_38325 [Paenibacillus rhizoplanae]